MTFHTLRPRPRRVLAPMTHFAGVNFEMVHQGGHLATWQPHPVIRVRKVAGRSLTKRQHMAYEADTLDIDIILANGDAYANLLAAMDANEPALLRLPAIAVVTTSADTTRHMFGVDYVEYADATLAELRDVTLTREGWVKASARFERDHPEAT